MLLQKRFDAGQHDFMCIFKHIMTGIGNSQSFRCRKTSLEFVEKIGRETPVFFSPDQQHGMRLELLQTRFDMLQGLIAGMI